MAQTKAIRDVRMVKPGRPRKYQDVRNTVAEAIALSPRKQAVKALMPERMKSVDVWSATLYSIAKYEGWKLHYNSTDPDLAENEMWVWVTKK